ncbi:helicase associated domain-containing protein [Streptomyces erythrochromogenes]|uniref:helicase associated domain-containing protein n=1 Tax=Streptomyces erythrochromogenes TaxID=285574 RepID=UPI00382F693C
MEIWVAERQRAYRAGQMTGLRAARLERLGMVWSVADERFQENRAAARVYYEELGRCARPVRFGDGPAGGASGCPTCGVRERWTASRSGRPRSWPSVRTGTRGGRPIGSGTTP